MFSSHYNSLTNEQTRDTEFMAAVEAKQVAQQEAERAKFIVTQALEEKRSKIIRAEGEAKAAALISEKMKNPGYVELRRLEAATEIAQALSRSANKVYLSTESLLLNILDGVNARK